MVSSNDVQRLFLQAIFSRRIVTQKLAIKLWQKCVEAVQAEDETLEIPFSDTQEAWDEWVTQINKSLNPLDLELAHMIDQGNGRVLYALVNRKGDEVAQIATEYSATEIAYFKNLIEQIMLAPNETYCISSFAALREVGNLKPVMTKTQGEIVLNSFVSKGWLHFSRGGKYSLSRRSLLELQSYLKSAYPDEVLECTICFEMVTEGMSCKTPNCKARLHKHCYTVYRRRLDTCPTCSEKWGNDPAKVGEVGEGGFRDGQDKGKRRARRRSEGSDEEDEEEPEMNYDESQPSQSQPSQSQPARSQRKGKKKAVREDSMEVDDDEDAEATPPPTTQRRKSSRR
ncbi:Nse1 non-SMC component of SMC5-6 complex-domain-containing protein [Cristinia sonorae]|uniref:Non-structural maintenance of chromosomes element 1 homolog n=1 Tax=Cristinia sonorae TaxID=1940300 RepID=A0A8K0UX32_9AGAR|nr:Nse1 non-SMC component of SMC5-6 complex-domain-containing protein [Cristinia sonorae]